MIPPPFLYCWFYTSDGDFYLRPLKLLSDGSSEENKL